MTLFPLLKKYIRQEEGVVTAVAVQGPEAWVGQKALIPANSAPTGPLLKTPLRAEIIETARSLLRHRQSATRHYSDPDVLIFFDVQAPAPKLIIVGGVHIAIELIHFAKPLGLRTYVVDPRTAFATEERFAHADALLHAWPDEALPEIGLTGETSVVVVTHDPKLDDPALQVALPSQAQYVGALGSPQTHAQRVERLLGEGLTREQVNRLHAPIGLDIGGRTPAEIALSIIAEIVAVRNETPLAAQRTVAG